MPRNKRQQEKSYSNVKGISIENVKTFKYLGHTLEEDNDDWPALGGNLNCAREKGATIGSILSREKAKPKVKALFYKAITQAV